MAAPLRILHINCNYIRSQLHQLLIRSLTKLGIESKVYVQVFYGDKSIVKPDGNVIVSECFNFRDRYIFDYKQWKILKDIKKYYDFTQFDCIHAYTLFTDGNTARRLSKEFGIPYVVAVRDTDIRAFFKKAFWLRGRGVRILEDARYVFFLSESYKKEVICNYVPKEKQESVNKKSLVIPNGIDDFWLDRVYTFKAYGAVAERIKKRKLRLIFVGALIKRKNVVTTLKAIDILINRGWDISFTVIGRAEDKEQYDTVNKNPYTRYLGPKTKEEIIRFLREADIFVMPSTTETFGLAYAEAMTQGLPVIYTRGQGFDGQFPEGCVGYAADCFSPEEIADNIIRITENYSLISKNCLAYCRHFNWHDIAEKYISVYHSII